MGCNMKALKGTLLSNAINALMRAEKHADKREASARAAIDKAIGPKGVKLARLRLAKVRAERESRVTRALGKALDNELSEHFIRQEKQYGITPGMGEVNNYVSMEKPHLMYMLLTSKF